MRNYVCVSVCLQDQTDNISQHSSFPVWKERTKYQQLNIISPQRFSVGSTSPVRSSNLWKVCPCLILYVTALHSYIVSALHRLALCSLSLLFVSLFAFLILLLPLRLADFSRLLIHFQFSNSVDFQDSI